MLKFALLLVLCIVQADRVIDTRLEDAEELNVYLTMGEHLTLILGGSAGTGGKWFYGFTNQWLVQIQDQKYEYLGEEGETGAPFQLTLELKALDKIPQGIENLGDIRLAYARSSEYQTARIYDKNEPDKWRETAWYYKTLHVYVSHMEKIEFHRNVDAYSSLAVQMGTLIEITVPERPNDIEGAWQIHASNSLDGEIILLDARYEHKDADRGEYGRTIFIVYCNQEGKWDLPIRASWGVSLTVGITVLSEFEDMQEMYLVSTNEDGEEILRKVESDL